jgi:hypothetical protein
LIGHSQKDKNYSNVPRNREGKLKLAKKNNFILEIGVEESIVNAPWITDQYHCHLEHKALMQQLFLIVTRDVTVKASSKNELNIQNLIKTVKSLVRTLFF